MSASIWGSIDGWIAVAGLAIGTFLIRYSFIGLLAGKKLPLKFERALQFAVPAIFAAIVIPLVVMANGRVELSLRAPHLLAACVTGLVAWWRGGMMLPVLSGMATLYTFNAIFVK